MDDRVSVEIDIENDVLFALMLEAHRQDVTLNQLVNDILREYMDKHAEQHVAKRADEIN